MIKFIVLTIDDYQFFNCTIVLNYFRFFDFQCFAFSEEYTTFLFLFFFTLVPAQGLGKWVGVRMTQRQNDTVRHFGTKGHFGTATK